MHLGHVYEYFFGKRLQKKNKGSSVISEIKKLDFFFGNQKENEDE